MLKLLWALGTFYPWAYCGSVRPIFIITEARITYLNLVVALLCSMARWRTKDMSLDVHVQG